jgi:hypothetical protein
VKTLLSVFFLAELAFPGRALALNQELPPVGNPLKTTNTAGSTETIQETKTITDSGTNKTSTDTLTGKMVDYQPGKWIEVSSPGKIERVRTIDLTGKNLTAHVASDVKVGEWVTVVANTDNDGRKTVVVERAKHASESHSR